MIKDLRLPDLGEGLTESEIVGRKVGGGRSRVTNIGVFGIDAGKPILNPGEAAILAEGIRPGAHCGESSTSGPRFSACPRQSAPGPPGPLAMGLHLAGTFSTVAMAPQ